MFPCADRLPEDTESYFTPAPNRYKILGDFDYVDPLDPKKLPGGKKPKFAYGMKTLIKAPNAEVPGPGSYETD